MATAPSPNDLTRQQLDELDALLQRMLALPLNPPETPAPRPTPEPPPPVLPVVGPNWRADPPAPAPAPHLLLAANALPLPDPIPEPVPVVESAPLRVAAKQEPDGDADRAPLRVADTREPVAPHPAPDLPPLPPQPPATTIVPPAPWHLVPLVAVNRLTDAAFRLLGPVGKVARSGFGRNLFGVAGLVLIAYTAARVAQVSGLLSLPFPLPWPR